MSQMHKIIKLFVFSAGTGFVGRHLATYLVSNQLCSKVRVVDKVPPATAWLSQEHKVCVCVCVAPAALLETVYVTK